jgi:sporulation protein YlmC with PRC-barrel domain
MTKHHTALLTSAALALALPSLALAQDTAVEEPDAATEMEMGVTEVEPTSAAEPMDLSAWTYDDLYASGISIEEMVGADVYGPEGDDIGDVENVLFDMDGQVLSVVAEIGGFLELGDTHVNIPWDMVSAEDWSDGIVIPFGEDEVEAYVATGWETGDQVAGAEEVAEVGGDGAGEVETGPNVWRATDLLNNSARLREGEAFANYGLVSDIVVQDGRIAAVLVTPDATWGAAPGVYGYPYAGTGAWTRGTAVGADAELAAEGTTGMAGTYDLPYDRTQAETLQPFDPAMLTD